MVSNDINVTDVNYWPPRNKDMCYDWSKTTVEVYKDDTVQKVEGKDYYEKEKEAHNTNMLRQFSPIFAQARSQLDYTYHTNLVLNRQILQDSILGRVIQSNIDNNNNNNKDDDMEKDDKKQDDDNNNDDNDGKHKKNHNSSDSEEENTSPPSSNNNNNYNNNSNNNNNQVVSNDDKIRSNNEEDETKCRITSTGTPISNNKIITNNKNNNNNNKPWIIFSAGPMGVGKGYVLTQLQQLQLIDLTKFILIDPDKIKTELPEMSGYIQINKTTAATKLHRESTLMSDILLEYAIQAHVPVLVDGSLRDVNYYKLLFQRLKEKERYNIAIIHVTATKDIIFERAKRRGEKSGRIVPEDLLEESIRQVPQSVQQLTSYADVVYTISNNEGQPIRIQSAIVRNNDNNEQIAIEQPTWNDFKQTWLNNTDDELCDDNMQEILLCNNIPNVNMRNSFDGNIDNPNFNIANHIWLSSYPNFCARCALSCDGQCGICIHGKHLCACTICK